MQTAGLHLVTEYGQLTRPQEQAQTVTAIPPSYPYAKTYRPYMVAEKHEEIIHFLQLIVWRDAQHCDYWGMPYAGISVWDLSDASLAFSCYGYRVTIDAIGLSTDWQFREALGKHRIKSICAWNAALHKRPPARTACITRIIRVDEEI